MVICRPIYVSLTSIFQKQHLLLYTLKSIIKQTVLPSKIYLFLSETPYLLDQGFTNKIITDIQLNNFINKHSLLITVVWVDNEGPYRKLLPLLKIKWNEECIIITVDDDTEYDNELIEHLVNDYNTHNCVINYRGFTPKINKIDELNYKNRDVLINNHLFNFPTGKGGVLYIPSFFHNTQDLIFNKEIYLNNCKTADDIWFMLIRVANNVECYINKTTTFMKKDYNHDSLSLFRNYNSKNNNEQIQHTIKCLKDLQLFN